MPFNQLLKNNYLAGGWEPPLQWLCVNLPDKQQFNFGIYPVAELTGPDN